VGDRVKNRLSAQGVGASSPQLSRPHSRAGLAWAILACLPLAACSLGAKQALADKVAASVTHSLKAGTAVGTVSLSVSVTRSSVGDPSSFPPVRVGPIPIAIDFSTDRAELGADPSVAGAIPQVVFAGTNIYQRRASSTAGGLAAIGAGGTNSVVTIFKGPIGILALAPPSTAGSGLHLPGISAKAGSSLAAAPGAGAPGAKPATSRLGIPAASAAPSSTTTTAAPGANSITGSAQVTGSSDVNLGPGSQQWFEYSFSTLPQQSIPVSAGALGINPVLLVRLLHGALAGSIKSVGTDTVDGVSATHYVLNLDPSQLVSDLPSKQQNDVLKQLGANGVSTNAVVPSDVWLDSSGLPRRIKLQIPQFIDRGDSASLTATIDFKSFGGPVAIGLPGVDEVAQVQSFGQLIQTVSSA